MMLSTKKQLKNVLPWAEPVSVNPCNRWTMEDEDESIPVIFGFIKNWNINTIDIILFKHPITASQKSQVYNERQKKKFGSRFPDLMIVLTYEQSCDAINNGLYLIYSRFSC